MTVEIKTEWGDSPRYVSLMMGAASPEEVALAFLPHATSKIQTLDDLSHAVSLGFRGEAPASIAAVARVTLTSAERGGSGRFSYQGGGVGPSSGREGARPAGDKGFVVVEDLFFNTPARRKSLAAHGVVEMALANSTMESFALAEPAWARIPPCSQLGFTRLSSRGDRGTPRGSRCTLWTWNWPV